MAWQIVKDEVEKAVIRVIGVGGGGGNAVAHMVAHKVEGVQFIAANTDVQALQRTGAEIQLTLGVEMTRGLGAGADPEVGERAALADRDKIEGLLRGADMVFITAGLGGGTGTGAAPVVAKIAREMDILTVAVVTKPFEIEGRKRMAIAETGFAALEAEVDSLINIPNQRLLEELGGTVTLEDAFKAVDDILLGAVQGVADIITKPGVINVDFADVRTAMSERGKAMMGTGTGSGPDRATQAVTNAVTSPLLEDVELRDAGGILINITASPSLNLREIQTIGEHIGQFSAAEAMTVLGVIHDPGLGEEIRVTVVATGLSKRSLRPVEPRPSRDWRGPNLPTKPARPPVQGDLDYLDVPAFVRRQVD